MSSILPKHNGHHFTTRLFDRKEGLPQVRLGIRLGDYTLESMSNEDSPWYESEEEVNERLDQGRMNRDQLALVRKVMKKHLNKSQMKVVELRFFEGLSLREIGNILGRDPSSVHRKIERALSKLQRHFQK